MFFIVSKRTWGWLSILDLKHLNRYVFHMEPVHFITQAVQQDNFLASLDLIDAYLHVPILPAHSKYLGFAYYQGHY